MFTIQYNTTLVILSEITASGLNQHISYHNLLCILISFLFWTLAITYVYFAIYFGYCNCNVSCSGLQWSFSCFCNTGLVCFCLLLFLFLLTKGLCNFCLSPMTLNYIIIIIIIMIMIIIIIIIMIIIIITIFKVAIASQTWQMFYLNYNSKLGH